MLRKNHRKCAKSGVPVSLYNTFKMFESLHFVLHSCLLSLELQAYGKSPKQDRMPGTRSSNFGGRVLVRNSAEVASANLRFRNKEMRQRVVERAIAANTSSSQRQ